MGNDRSSLALLAAMLLLGALAVAPAPPAPAPSPKRPAEKTADARSSAPDDDPVIGLLREFWDVPRAESKDLRSLAPRFRGTHSSALIATITDPRDSRMSASFDQSVEAFMLAASAAGYTLDRHWLPWPTGAAQDELTAKVVPGTWNAAAPAVTVTSQMAKARYREQPGALLFRNNEERERALLVLLVGETATTGVHAESLRAALDAATALRGGDDSIAIVGPSFSGSAPTLANTLWNWRTTHLSSRIRLFSAGATSEKLPKIFNGAGCSGCGSGDLRFNALTWSSKATRGAMDEFLRSRGSDARNTVLFYEAGTAYGATAIATDGKAPPAKDEPQRVPYPLHLAEMRAAWDSAGLLADDKTLNSRARASLSLALDDVRHGRDVPPVFAPVDSANSAELQLTSVLADLKRQGVEFVGILGSDVHDKLFLARQIKRVLPDVQLYTLLADVTYLHPRWLRDLNGMWVASSYPLTTESQPPGTLRPFAAHGQQAAYNALLAALAEVNPREAETIATSLVDYYRDGGKMVGPSLWISAVGNGEFWGVEEYPPSEEARLREPGPRAPASIFWSPPIARAGDSSQPAKRRFYPPFLFTAVAWSALLAGSLYLLLAPPQWVPWGRSSALRWLLWPAPAPGPRRALAATWFAVLSGPLLYGAAISPSLRHPGWSGNAAHAAAGAAMDHGAAGAAWRRALDFGSGLSPLVPTLWLAGCALVLVYAAARRHQLLQFSSAMATVMNGTAFAPLATRLRAALREPGGERSADACAPWLLGAAPAGLAAWIFWSSPIRGLDPGWLLVVQLAFVLLVYAVAVTGCSFVVVWQRLRVLLRAVGRTPLLHAFERLPSHCAEALGFRSSRGAAQLSELRDAIDRLRLLRARSGTGPFAAQSAPASEIAEVYADEVRQAGGSGAWAYGAQAQMRLSTAASWIWSELERRWTDDLTAAGGADHATPAAGGAKSAQPTDALHQHRTRPTPALPQLACAEEFVAAELVRYFGFVFLHLRVLLTGAMVGALALFLAVMSYPFHPQQTLLRFTMGLVVALVASFAVVLIQSERNTLLSTAANRRPNHVDFDAHFLQQAGTFVGLPLLTMLVTQFPALDELVQRLRGY